MAPLLQLVDDGIAVIPTTYVSGAEELVLANDLIKGDVVVKPTVSAGANDTLRVDVVLISPWRWPRVIENAAIA